MSGWLYLALALPIASIVWSVVRLFQRPSVRAGFVWAVRSWFAPPAPSSRAPSARDEGAGGASNPASVAPYRAWMIIRLRESDDVARRTEPLKDPTKPRIRAQIEVDAIGSDELGQSIGVGPTD